MITSSTHLALRHLKSIKPYDGWAVETSSSSNGKSTKVRLLRRNVPINEKWFLDIALDPSSNNSVVGIVSSYKGADSKNKASGIVLIESNGTPSRDTTRRVLIEHTVESQPSIPLTTTSNSRSSTTSTRSTNDAVGGGQQQQQRNNNESSSSSTTTTENNDDGIRPLSDEENKKLITYALYGIGGLIAFKVLASAMTFIYIMFFPIVIIYALQTCPPNDTFDAKKELKRVLRGHHLAENDPNKPRGWLEETATRMAASVSTELATAISGYELSMIPLLGACTIATMKVPSVNREYYWIGIFGQWRYMFSSELERTNNTTSTAAAAASRRSYKRD